jgi:hypothetical protein
MKARTESRLQEDGEQAMQGKMIINNKIIL